MGLSNIPQLARTWHVFLFLVVILYAFHMLQRSGYGRALVAIGHDETAAKSMGIPTARYKAMAFVAGAVMASVSGSFSRTLPSTFRPPTSAFPRPCSS